MEKLSEFVDEFLYKVAGKEKINRKKVISNLEKAKGEHNAAKKQLEIHRKQHAKSTANLDQMEADTSGKRKKMLRMYDVVQKMDLADANEAIFYQDCEDIGYIVDGKEYHLEVNDMGDLDLVPMNKFRRDRKMTASPIKSEEEKTDVEDDEDHSNIDDTNEIENLYVNLLQR